MINLRKDREFIKLMEANLEELILNAHTPYKSQELNLYRELLILFYKGDISGVQNFVISLFEKFQAGEIEYSLYLLASLRLQLLTKSPNTALIEELIFSTTIAPQWRGEVLLVSAAAYELLGNLVQAKEFYLQALVDFESSGFKRRAIRSQLNALAMESQINPNRRLFTDFYAVYRKAKKHREYRSAGIALSNISREYFNIGAFDIALKYVNSGLSYLQKEIGSQAYYKALVNRCHILFQLSRSKEAELDLQDLSLCPFPEIQEAVKVIEKDRNQNGVHEINPNLLLPMWRERLLRQQNIVEKKSKFAQGKLGELEEAVIRLLSHTPKDKYEIIKFIYGEREDFHVLEARLKTLLFRIRKKAPGLIVLEHSKYKIADTILVPSFLRNTG